MGAYRCKQSPLDLGVCKTDADADLVDVGLLPRSPNRQLNPHLRHNSQFPYTICFGQRWRLICNEPNSLDSGHNRRRTQSVGLVHVGCCAYTGLDPTMSN